MLHIDLTHRFIDDRHAAFCQAVAQRRSVRLAGTGARAARAPHVVSVGRGALAVAAFFAVAYAAAWFVRATMLAFERGLLA